MPDFAEVIKFLLAIATLSGIITGGAIYYTRKSMEQIAEFTKQQVKDIDKRTSTAITEIKQSFAQYTQNTRDDYNRLITHIDERIDKIYAKMESNTQELKEYVSSEVTSLKAKDYDQDVKIEHTKDKVHGLSEELLRFKLEASETYERRAKP